MLNDLKDIRIIEMDYFLLSYVGEWMNEFVGDNKKWNILRLFWKSKEKHKMVLLRGEE
jgi:hypothetical protein